MAAPVLVGERVRLRPWADADLAPFAELNADPEVMRHLIAPLSREESDAQSHRIRERMAAQGHGLWALDAPDAHGRPRFAGFVGLNQVPFEIALPGIVAAPTEIGWRLARWAWGHGYATEAARLALRHGFEVLRLPQLVSFTSLANTRSQAVMQRTGFTRRGEFDHPRVAPDHAACRQVLFALDAPPGAA